jgi:FkbM family methyltransferase
MRLMRNFVSRASCFLNRFSAARKHGFLYRGTSYTPFPRSLRIAERTVPLADPIGTTCVLDVFNVVLDDEYGLAKLAVSPKTILDIGANMGLFALAAKHHHPTARIDCYEPSTAAAAVARYNLLNFEHINVHTEAIGVTAGTCRLLIHAQSRLSRTEIHSAGDIPVTAIEEAVRRVGGEVDLLKMDCEGAEWDLFANASEILANVPEIRMEYHLTHGHTVEELQSLARASGHCITHLTALGNHGIAWLSKTVERFAC